MKKKIRAYLDTPVVSALFDENNPERRSLTRTFFDELTGFEILISEITIAEIERTADSELRERMRSIVHGFRVLELTDEVEWLANEYVKAGAVPGGYPEDAYHIAVAVLNDVDFLLSWNFKHIVRKKTRDIVRMVNTLNRARQIEIMTPIELL